MDIATILATCNARPPKTNTNLLAELAGSAPAALDSIQELAAALNDDANFVINLSNTLADKANTTDVTTWLSSKANSSTVTTLAGTVANKANKSNPEFSLSGSVAPTSNLDLVIEATSDTTITFKLKGSDGTVRTGTLTLS